MMKSPIPKFQPQLADVKIVKRVLLGEKELFEILLRRNNQSPYRVIRSYLKDDNDAQDAMQEAYLKAYDKLQQFQGNSSFSTWLIRIGINEALLQIRAKKNTASLYVEKNHSQLQRILQITDSTQWTLKRQRLRGRQTRFTSTYTGYLLESGHECVATYISLLPLPSYSGMTHGQK